MNEILKLLEQLYPEVDFEDCDSLVDDNILDTDELDELVAELEDRFDVVIPEDEITADNFNSVESIYSLIQELQ